jgi:hypothetical protein
MIDTAARAHIAGILSLPTAISETGLELDVQSEVSLIDKDKLRIKTIRDLRDALSSDPPLIDIETALIMLYGEDRMKEILPKIKTLTDERSVLSDIQINEFSEIS